MCRYVCGFSGGNGTANVTVTMLSVASRPEDHSVFRCIAPAWPDPPNNATDITVAMFIALNGTGATAGERLMEFGNPFSFKYFVSRVMPSASTSQGGVSLLVSLVLFRISLWPHSCVGF